jgi:hypothetical protein
MPDEREGKSHFVYDHVPAHRSKDHSQTLSTHLRGRLSLEISLVHADRNLLT